MRSSLVTLLAVLLLALLPGTVAAATPQNDAGTVMRVLELTNGERQKAGLRPLALSSELNVAAQTYSQVLATSGCFEHTCGPVPNFADRAAQSGYANFIELGENIAAGYPTPEAVVGGWMASAGHRANILSPNFTEMGIGLVSDTGQYGTYWTQEFGTRPESVAPPAAQMLAQAQANDDAADDTNDSGG